tara:strand:+ start:246 stop:914 length:669 start_codon:yes stop_codon:yes gene_type:complete
MKIEQASISTDLLQSNIKEAEYLLSKFKGPKAKPCIDCSKLCSCCNTKNCSADCSMNCPLAAEELSSDKTLYPIESKILPLVYILSALDVCKLCWSCEGHSDSVGVVNKVPQIWFYTDSLVFIRLLSECFGALYSSCNKAHRLSYLWDVVATYSAKDNMHNTFSIKPNLTFVNEINLFSLQHDILIMAELVPDKLTALCQDYLNRLQQTLLRCNEKGEITWG